MNEGDREQLKAKLLSEIEELRARLPQLKDEAKPVPPDNAVGRLSRMDAIREKGIREAALGAAKERLSRLDERLSHVDDPDFGKCLTCRQPIPIARLLYVPEADRCVNCA
ncbi:MAG: TraR/DksA C4-type zinc finger protein [Elusimicrobiota bacterium]